GAREAQPQAGVGRAHARERLEQHARALLLGEPSAEEDPHRAARVAPALAERIALGGDRDRLERDLRARAAERDEALAQARALGEHAGRPREELGIALSPAPPARQPRGRGAVEAHAERQRAAPPPPRGRGPGGGEGGVEGGCGGGAGRGGRARDVPGGARPAEARAQSGPARRKAPARVERERGAVDRVVVLAVALEADEQRARAPAASDEVVEEALRGQEPDPAEVRHPGP